MAESNVQDLTIAMGKQLSLTADEDVGLDLDDGIGNDPDGGVSKWCIVGTVLTRKRFNMEAMESTLAGVWRPVKGMHMRILGHNHFALYFFHPVDMNRVLAAGPWRFADHVMILKEAHDGKMITKEELFEVPFWIQIHDLPPSRMTEATGRRIGAEIGRLIEVDAGNGHVWGTDYIRVRVFIDSGKPLRRGMKLSLKDGLVWVSFRYERLPHFCYCCGMLDHVERDYEVGLELEHMGVTERPYDDRLRAASKRDRQEAATNNGRWLRDAAGFPTGENSRERHQLPKLGRRPVLEMSNVHGRAIGMNGRDYRDATKNPDEQMSALNPGCQLLQRYGSLENCQSDSSPKAKYMERQHNQGNTGNIVDICDGAPALNLNVLEKHSPTLGAPPPKQSGPGLSDNMEGQQGHNSDGPLHSIETQESDSIFVFSSTLGDNPPRTRSWKKEARERRHSSSHTLSSSCRIKRKDEQSHILVSEQLGGQKRGKGISDVGDAIILSAGAATQARQSP
ncbi:hypothetical protein SLE2022_345830 [Rubroshorea leprosula]